MTKLKKKYRYFFVNSVIDISCREFLIKRRLIFFYFYNRLLFHAVWKKEFNNHQNCLLNFFNAPVLLKALHILYTEYK